MYSTMSKIETISATCGIDNDSLSFRHTWDANLADTAGAQITNWCSKPRVLEI